MSTFSPRLSRGSTSHTVLAVIAAVILIAVLTGINERLGIGDTTAFWVLFLVGMAICAFGPLGQGVTYGWWNPLHILGYVLGAVLLLLGAAVLFDFSMPFVSTVQGATLVLAALMIVKGVLALFYRRQTSPSG